MSVPGNCRVFLYQFRTEPRGCLADDGQLLSDGIPHISSPANSSSVRPFTALATHSRASMMSWSLCRSRRIDRLCLGEHLRPDERLQGRLDGQIDVPADQCREFAGHSR